MEPLQSLGGEGLRQLPKRVSGQNAGRPVTAVTEREGRRLRRKEAGVWANRGRGPRPPARMHKPMDVATGSQARCSEKLVYVARAEELRLARRVVNTVIVRDHKGTSVCGHREALRLVEHLPRRGLEIRQNVDTGVFTD